MTAATGRVFGPKPYEGTIPWAASAPLAANVAPFRNWLLGLDRSTGYAQALAANTPNLLCVGFSDRDNASSTTAGEAIALARQQFVSGFVNSTIANDSITAASVAVPAWALDNQTIGLLSNSGGANRSLAGLAMGLDPDGLDGPTPILYPGPIGWLLARGAMIADATNAAHFAISDAAASSATAERIIPSAKVHGLVTAIQFTGAAIAADNTDYVTITIAKRDGAGGGAVTLGTYDSRAANQGAITAFTPAAFSLSAVAGALNILETDVITITVVKGGSGKTLTGAFRVVCKVQ